MIQLQIAFIYDSAPTSLFSLHKNVHNTSLYSTDSTSSFRELNKVNSRTILYLKSSKIKFASYVLECQRKCIVKHFPGIPLDKILIILHLILNPFRTMSCLKLAYWMHRLYNLLRFTVHNLSIHCNLVAWNAEWKVDLCTQYYQL